MLHYKLLHVLYFLLDSCSLDSGSVLGDTTEGHQRVSLLLSSTHLHVFCIVKVGRKQRPCKSLSVSIERVSITGPGPGGSARGTEQTALHAALPL